MYNNIAIINVLSVSEFNLSRYIAVPKIVSKYLYKIILVIYKCFKINGYDCYMKNGYAVVRIIEVIRYFEFF